MAVEAGAGEELGTPWPGEELGCLRHRLITTLLCCHYHVVAAVRKRALRSADSQLFWNRVQLSLMLHCIWGKL